MRPNFKEEKKLWKQGYRFVVGLDEAGRGPLAGPVTAAAVTVQQFPISNFQFPKIRDSKKLSEKKREEFYKYLTKHPAIKWGIGVISEKVIDKINILEATKLAMLKSIKNLSVKPDFLLIDGNFKLLEGPTSSEFGRSRTSSNLNLKEKSIIKADEKVFSCTAAGIIAKVTRDRLMKGLHKKYPQYGFSKHKGYGTALHLKNLRNFGPCKIHRKTFEPVKSIAKNQFV